MLSREEAKDLPLLVFRTNPITGELQPEVEELDDTMKLVIDKIYDSFKNRVCENCEFYPQKNEPYPEVCGCCSRFYTDNFEENKDD